MNQKRFWLIAAASFILATAIMGWLAWTYRSFELAHAGEADRPGVSFSIAYSQELGLNWQQTYLALLNDLHIKRFRLMSYWEEIEPTPGQYDFSALDFEMDQANKSGAKVSLAIGLRQPRWPECHQPAWVANLSPLQQQERLQAVMTAVVERYRDNPALENYQLENEALNTVFGSCSNFDRRRLVSEFNLVKSLDPNHPIIVSVSNEYGLPVGQPRGDEVGFSVYRRVFDATITKHYVSYPFPPWWFGLKAALIEKLLHRTSMIHELQAEPWGPKPTAEMSIQEQDRSMDANRLKASVKYAQATKIKEYYLWGGEWWYWRMVKFNDPSLWDAARTVYKY
ncbi:MAG TPA: beta-galactosidase [Candidatus Saccharimonadales bacterium]|nr:beta-galactosidase [Candidatus Saccharimonadales bacterium]